MVSCIEEIPVHPVKKELHLSDLFPLQRTKVAGKVAAQWRTEEIMQPGAFHSHGLMSASHFTMETSKKRYLSTMVLPSVRSSQTQCKFSSIHSEISLSEYIGIHPLYTVKLFTLCRVDLYGLLHNFLDEGNLSEQHFCVHRFGLQYFFSFFSFFSSIFCTV